MGRTFAVTRVLVLGWMSCAVVTAACSSDPTENQPGDAGSDATADDVATSDASVDSPVDGANDVADASDTSLNDAPDGWAPTGAPCAKSGTVEERQCGYCGRHSRICQEDGDG